MQLPHSVRHCSPSSEPKRSLPMRLRPAFTMFPSNRRGAHAVGVSWGMHTSDQLRAAGAEFVAVWPQELISYLRPESQLAGSSESACQVVAAEKRHGWMSVSAFTGAEQPSGLACTPELARQAVLAAELELRCGPRNRAAAMGTGPVAGH